jgi:hypothetical protein
MRPSYPTRWEARRRRVRREPSFWSLPAAGRRSRRLHPQHPGLSAPRLPRRSPRLLHRPPPRAQVRPRQGGRPFQRRQAPPPRPVPLRDRQGPPGLPDTPQSHRRHRDPPRGRLRTFSPTPHPARGAPDQGRQHRFRPLPASVPNPGRWPLFLAIPELLALGLPSLVSSDYPGTRDIPALSSILSLATSASSPSAGSATSTPPS